jgi:hypothetical protein
MGLASPAGSEPERHGDGHAPGNQPCGDRLACLLQWTCSRRACRRLQDTVASYSLDVPATLPPWHWHFFVDYSDIAYPTRGPSVASVLRPCMSRATHTPDIQLACRTSRWHFRFPSIVLQLACCMQLANAQCNSLVTRRAQVHLYRTTDAQHASRQETCMSHISRIAVAGRKSTCQLLYTLQVFLHVRRPTSKTT